jgi:hypothetical protein
MPALLIWTVNLALIANGAFMLLWPETWYGFVPGVVDTGPFNPHFVRDIGAAYLVAGGGLLWFTLEKRARPAAIAGAAFLALHAVVHLWDAVAGHEALVQLLEDGPTVILPAALIFKVARPRPRSPKETSDAEMAHAAADRRL